MKLTYFEGKQPNFGDELNKIMWNQLLPEGFLDQDGDNLFLGIGSILWDYLPSKPVKHVIGSGYGGYTPPPKVAGEAWNIVWVRGPLTAQALGIDPRLSITDSAVLLRAIALPKPALDVDVAFMPHFESIERGDWAKVCNLAGITYLDPRDPPISTIAKILGARLVLTEAMHGAIVSDALRTPFVPFLPHQPLHRMKWDDWAASLDLELIKHPLPVTTAVDFYVRQTGRLGKGRISKSLKNSKLMQPVHSLLSYSAAEKLQKIARNAEPILSTERNISSATDRCLVSLQRFVRSRT